MDIFVQKLLVIESEKTENIMFNDGDFKKAMILAFSPVAFVEYTIKVSLEMKK